MPASIATPTRAVTRRAVLAGAALAAPALLRAGPVAAAGVLNVTAHDGFVPPAFGQAFEAETGAQVRIRLIAGQAPELTLLPDVRRPCREVGRPGFSVDEAALATGLAGRRGAAVRAEQLR